MQDVYIDSRWCSNIKCIIPLVYGFPLCLGLNILKSFICCIVISYVRMDNKRNYISIAHSSSVLALALYNQKGWTRPLNLQWVKKGENRINNQESKLVQVTNCKCKGMDPLSNWSHVSVIRLKRLTFEIFYNTRNQEESSQGLHSYSAAECCPHIFMDSIQYVFCESVSIYILFIFIN